MSNELQKQSTAALERPSYIEQSSEGLEQVGMKDMVLPRLTLCQNNSRARDKNNKKYIPGLEEGLFFNSLTNKIYGDSVQIVPLFFYHSRMMFRDMKEGGGLLCQAPDGISCQLNQGGPCLHSAWGAGGEPPECMEFFNYPALLYTGPGNETILTRDWAVVSLKTTGLNAGRTLNSLMRLRGCAAYAGIYRLSAIPDKNKTGQAYYTWIAENGKPPFVDPELLKYSKQMYQDIFEGLKAGTVKVDDSDEAFADHDSEV